MGLLPLKRILTDILNDDYMQDAILIVDALDECHNDSRDQLIDLIIELSGSSKAKWIVSSRNWSEIEEKFKQAQNTRLQLELNKDVISLAVKAFIRCKVDTLAASKGYDDKTKTIVYEELQKKAHHCNFMNLH